MAIGKKDVGKKVCEKCGGMQFILTNEGPVPCECRQEELLKKRLKAAKIPRRYENKTIETFAGNDKKRRQLRNDANAYVKGFPPTEGKKGLLFLGTTGCGKTHLAIGILKAIINKGYTGYYCNIIDFFRMLKETYISDSGYDELALLERIGSADFLVLDDLGAEKPTEWKIDRLYTIVNRRYEQNLPILVTTNKRDTEELKGHVGERIISRLYEMCQIIDYFPDEDYRMRGLDLSHHLSEKRTTPTENRTGGGRD